VQARLLKAKLMLKNKDYSGTITEVGRVLKVDESDLDALLLRGKAYFYLADHDVALRYSLSSMIYLLVWVTAKLESFPIRPVRQILHKTGKVLTATSWWEVDSIECSVSFVSEINF